MFDLAPTGSTADIYGWRDTVVDAQKESTGYGAPVVPATLRPYVSVISQR